MDNSTGGNNFISADNRLERDPASEIVTYTGSLRKDEFLLNIGGQVPDYVDNSGAWPPSENVEFIFTKVGSIMHVSSRNNMYFRLTGGNWLAILSFRRVLIACNVPEKHWPSLDPNARATLEDWYEFNAGSLHASINDVPGTIQAALYHQTTDYGGPALVGPQLWFFFPSYNDDMPNSFSHALANKSVKLTRLDLQYRIR